MKSMLVIGLLCALLTATGPGPESRLRSYSELGVRSRGGGSSAAPAAQAFAGGHGFPPAPYTALPTR